MILVKKKNCSHTAGLQITPRVHEVRAPLETLAFLGRSNLVEPDEVSGGPQATDRLAIIMKKRVFYFNQCPLKSLSLIRYSKMVRANAGETRGAPMGRDERETACYAMACQLATLC